MAEKTRANPTPMIDGRSHRRLWISLIASLAVAVTGAACYVAASSHPADEAMSPAKVSTAVVTKGNMVAETRLPATVQYSDKYPVTAGPSGTVTELPPVGASIAAGNVMYRVDTRPVILLSGSMPAWRDFTSGMTDGEDVRQLEQNLAAFGVFRTTPDAHFSRTTMSAIRDWQRSLGVEKTGSVEKAMVMFSDQTFRVDSLEIRTGSQVAPGSALYTATSVRQVIELDLPSSKRELASVGGTVTITAATGSDIAGIVETVGVPASRPNVDGSGTSVVIPVRISIADQAAVTDLALASVTVSFAGILKEDVLTVPVEALVPNDDSRFAVELPRKSAEGTRKLIPVTVGAFASGMVEIAGEGIVDGLAVVVPAA